MRLIPLLLTVMLVFSSAVMAGCRPKASTPPPEALEGDLGEPVEGDWIVERLEGEPPTLNPLMEASGASSVLIVSRNIFESLLERDFETLELEPSLAESYEISEDNLTYTFKLKPNIKFSDGVPLTSEDVKFTVDAILNPANDTGSARSYFSDVSSVDAPDPLTVVFNCSKPYFLHLTQFGALPILPKHIYGEGDFNTHPANRAPVGSGVFKFDRWDTGQQLTLIKRADYWGDVKPYVNRLVYKFITDDNAAFQVLQQQQVDMMRVGSEKWMTEAKRADFEAKFNKFELYSQVNGYQGIFGWIGWNARRPMLQDKQVRQALTHLLDRDTILATIFHGLGRVVSGYHFPDSPEYDQSIKPWPFDPARAAQLLDEAGWVDTNNNGLRDKDGVEFRFEWIYPTGTPEYDRMATVYKEQLQKAGIEVVLRPLDWGTFIDSVTKREFDACMMAWVSPPETDPYQIWHSSQAEGGSNYVGFVNAEADQIIEQARVEFDRDKRVALYHRLHAILHEEQPYTFLFNTQRKIPIDKRFQDVKVYRIGFDVYEWWVPKELQRYKD